MVGRCPAVRKKTHHLGTVGTSLNFSERVNPVSTKE
jgi:hypothetical protein